MEISTIVLFGLAIWRVASLLVNEDGPWGIFYRFRYRWLGIREGLNGTPQMTKDGFFPQLFSCVWCLSLWLAIVWYVGYKFNHTVFYTISIPLAWSAVAILVERFARK